MKFSTFDRVLSIVFLISFLITDNYVILGLAVYSNVSSVYNLLMEDK